jgi:hypothetical protein
MDAAMAILMALVVVVALVLHRLRARAEKIAGYWRPVYKGAARGGEFEATLVPDKAVERGARLVVVGRNSNAGPVLRMHGATKFPRRVCIDGDPALHCGLLDLAGRKIEWGGGEAWIREGVDNQHPN